MLDALVVLLQIGSAGLLLWGAVLCLGHWLAEFRRPTNQEA